MLDILYVGTLPPHQGGSAISGAQILTGLSSLGHRIRSIAAVTASTDDDARRWERSHPHIEVQRYEMPFFEVEPTHPAAPGFRRAERAPVLRLLTSEIARARPDLIFIGRETFSVYAVPVAQKYGLPCVQRVAGGVVLGILNDTLSRQHGLRFLKHMVLANRIVSPAQHMREALVSLGLDNVAVIPNTVDNVRFCPGPKSGTLLERYAIPPNSPVIAHISNLKRVKRCLDIVDCAEKVLKIRHDAVFVVIGDGALDNELKLAIRSRGMTDSFRYTGWVSYEQLPEWYRSVDIVLLPSQVDTQPRVYLETLASGSILVASDIPAARDVVHNGESALLHPVGDIRAMADSVLTALNQPGLAERLRSAGPVIAKRHSPEQTIPQYEEVFKAL